MAIARVNLVRFFRERAAIFNVFALPFLIVLLLGASSGGSAIPTLGFHGASDDGLTTEMFESLGAVEGMEVEEFAGEDDAVRGVERGELQAALLVPAGYEASLLAGEQVEIRFVKRAEQELQGITGVVNAVVTQQATLLRTARFAEDGGYGTFDEALGAAQQVQMQIPPVAVVATTAGEPFVLGTLGQFDIWSQTMLVLFMFMTTMSGAINLVQTRRLGVAQRMYSTPTTVSTMVAGEALSRMSIALIQGLFVFGGTALVFGTDWGNPIAALVIILVFALVSTGAAMMLGAFVNNEQQANGLATTLGLGLAALGGAMFPLAAMELLSETVYRVAHVTPHAWALDAFLELVVEDGGLADIGVYLLALLGFAAVFFGLAVWRLRRVLVR